MMFAFSSCEKEIIVQCDCNCQCGNSDNSNQEPNRPGDNNSGNTGDSGNTGNSGNTGGSGDSGNSGGSGGSGGSGDENGGGIDRSEYTSYNTTFTKAKASNYGVFYDDQPSNTTNWYLELADNNFNLDTYDGDGYNIVLEFFTNSSYTSSFPAGEYTIERFEATPYSAGSLLYGFMTEQDGEQYASGTWLYEGLNGVAGATAGKMTIAVSGSNYSISYTLYDDDYQIAFSGSYTGSVSFYDLSQSNSLSQATKSGRPAAGHYRVRL